MLPKCIDAVNAAAGRALSRSELNAIEARLDATSRRLARADATRWAGMSREQRMNEAAATAMRDIEQEAVRKLDTAHRQILASAETSNRVEQLQDSYKGRPGHTGSRVESLKRDLLNSALYVKSVQNELRSLLFDTIQAAKGGHGSGIGHRALQVIFDVEDPRMTADLAREIFAGADGSTGNEFAKLGARAWLDTVEAARQRFNAAGGEVRKLEYGYVPQPWSSSKVKMAGADKFADLLMQHVDRRYYLNEDGSRMSDAALRETMKAAAETIGSEGLNKVEPGQYRSAGKMANRGGDERVIHFKDGDSYLAVMREFGSGSMYDAMTRHVDGMARRIGLVERYGPDPTTQMRLQYDLTARADHTNVETLAGAGQVNPQTYWKIVSGETGTPVNQRIADVGMTLRSLQVAGKLGWAIWSSLNDIGNVIITTGYNRLRYFDLIKYVAAQRSSETREFMASHGMISEALAGQLDRWSEDHMSHRWAAHFANSTMRLSLLTALTEGMRQGFRMTMAAGLARLAKLRWDELTEFDRIRLSRTGVTRGDWDRLNSVKPELFRGNEVLTPQAIHATGGEEAAKTAARVFGFMQHESETAVIESDMGARAITTAGGQQAGTYGGEIMRTIAQFKSYPFAMITRHWQRFLEGNHGAEGAPLLANRWVYGTAVMTSSLIAGAIGEQIYQMLRGKDPIDPFEHPKFWIRALLRGGGLSIAGDLLLMDTTQERSTQEALGRMALGPTFGTAADVYELTKGNIDEYLAGRDTHAAAEAIRLGKSLMPVANVWWVQPLLEHSFLSGLQENLSPGYLARIRAKAAHDWGQYYWWNQSRLVPDRAPEIEKAVGGH